MDLVAPRDSYVSHEEKSEFKSFPLISVIAQHEYLGSLMKIYLMCIWSEISLGTVKNLALKITIFLEPFSEEDCERYH